LADVDTNKILEALKNVAQDSTLRQLKGLTDQIRETTKSSVDVEKASQAYTAGAQNSAAEMLRFTNKVASGGARVSDVFGSTSKIIKALPLPDFASQLSEGAKSAFQLAEGGVDAWRSLSQYGANFNNSIMDMQNSAAQTRMSLDSFAGIVRDNSSALAGMGGTASKGADKFVKASQAMFDSGMAAPLLNMGMTFDDVNEQLMTNMEFNRRMMVQGKLSQDQAIAQTAHLGSEMDKIAKLTGKNRKEMEAEVNARMRKGQVEAKIRQLEASGNEEAAAKMRLALAEAEKAGPGALAAVEDLFTKGAVVSEEGRQAAIALGPAFNDLQKMVTNVGDKSVSVDQMGSSIDNFNSALAQRIQDPDFLNMATLGGMGNEFANAAAGLLENAGSYADGIAAIAKENNLDLKNRQDFNKAIQLANEAAKKSQDPKQGDAATQAVVQGEQALREMGAVINETLIGQDGTIRRFSRALEGPIDMMKGIDRAEMTESFKDGMRDLDKAVSTQLGVEGPGLPEKNISIQRGTPEQVDDLVRSIMVIPDAITQSGAENAAKTGQIIAKGLTDEFSLPFLEKIDQVIAGNEDVSTKVANLIKEGNLQQAEEIFNSVLKAQGVTDASIQMRKDVALTQSDPRQMTSDALANAALIETAPEMNGGTLGAFGTMFKDFGNETIAKLHGNEAVITPDQLEKMASGVSGMMQGVKGTPASAGGDTSGLTQAIANLSAKIDQMSASSSQSSNAEIAETLNTSLQQLTSTANRQFDIAKKQLKAQQGALGNVFKGL